MSKKPQPKMVNRNKVIQMLEDRAEKFLKRDDHTTATQLRVIADELRSGLETL